MTQLRESTTEHHRRAEGHPFQRSLAKGELAREGYVAWLGQMLLVHACLEAELARVATVMPEVASVLGEGWEKASCLRADLAFFGAEAAWFESTEGVRRLCAEIDRLGETDPLSLLGMFYVLEGSTNGGRFIARGVRRAYGLAASGTAYLDPYGESQRERWEGFKSRMRGLPLRDEQVHAMVAAAQAMFDGIAVLSEDLSAAAY